jgi:hypothetical protein
MFLPQNTFSLIEPMDQGVILFCKLLYRRKQLDEYYVFFKDENEGIFDDDIGEGRRGQKTLTRLKEYNIKSAIKNWASSWNEIKTKTFKNAWNKLISNEEQESDLEGIEEDVHGAFVADPSDVR